MSEQHKIGHGGKRINAGRKTGSGRYGEATTVIRIPKSQKGAVVDFVARSQQQKGASSNLVSIPLFEYPAVYLQKTALPLFTSKVRAGFPDVADEHVERRLDVTEYLVSHAETTFFATIIGDSMRDAGLLDGDKAVVDRAKQASIGDIVLAYIDGAFTIKTLGKNKQGMPRLIPANTDYPVIEITKETQFEIWGVVTGSFRKFS
ncbi:MAG: LexA family protein [Methylotenera sp.]